ncbi:hypothetical protein EOM82_07790 [bacterium]|nr:hypothetical protein [bacterium]
MKLKLIISESLLQIALSIGVLIAFGLLIWMINKLFYKLTGNAGNAVKYVTGLIGTPVHELSHALMCLVFLHKIKQIKLFQIDTENGVLGYVNHTYNKKNPYQCLGNLFIGTAPLVISSGILVAMLYFMLPNTYASLKTFINFILESTFTFSTLLKFTGSIFDLFFSYEMLTNTIWWMFLIIGCFIALHQTLSLADIKNSLGGLFVYIIIIFIFNSLAMLVGGNFFSSVTNGFNSFCLILFLFMLLSVLLSFFSLLNAIIIKYIAKLIKMVSKKKDR